MRIPLAGAEVEPEFPDAWADEALSPPPDLPARRAFLRRLVLTAVVAINRRDLDGYLSVFHPDVVIRLAQLEGGGLWGGDFDELYRGLEEVRRLLEQWLEPWDEIRLEPHEILDPGGDSFVALGEWVGTGRSGIEVRAPWPARFTLRGPLTARVDFYPSARVARAAVGLEE